MILFLWQGVLRIHVNRAKDLPRNDQTDSIDPYCVIQVGAPMWNESFEGCSAVVRR